MPSFKNFANGGIDNNPSEELIPTRHRQTRDYNVGSRIEKVWASDFEKCESRKDYEEYIAEYEKYDSNKYVAQARERIAAMDAEEVSTPSLKLASQTATEPNANPIRPQPKPRKHKKVIKTILLSLAALAAIGGTAAYSYYIYEKQEEEALTLSKKTQAEEAISLAESQLNICIEIDNENQQLYENNNKRFSKKYSSNCSTDSPETIEEYEQRVRKEIELKNAHIKSVSNCSSARTNLNNARDYFIEHKYEEATKVAKYVSGNLSSIQRQNTILKCFEP